MVGCAAVAACTPGASSPAASSRTASPASAPAYPPAGSLGLGDFPPHAAAPRPRPKLLLDGTRRLLPGHRVVAFYGLPGAPVLGVLGTGSAEQLWPRLATQARAFRHAGARVVPAYEVVAVAAIGSRGERGDFTSRVPDSTIARYAAAARRHQGYLILDVQPGRGSFLRDARSLRRWLRLPYVGLGLDPEWKLHGGQLPLQQIGWEDAQHINRVSAWLNRLCARLRLPQKLLLVHEFTPDMVRDKSDLRHRAHLATVFNIDGFGSAAAKVGRYAAFARHHRFPLGFKLFYRLDTGLMSPRRTLALRPSPVVVEYQ